MTRWVLLVCLLVVPLFAIGCNRGDSEPDAVAAGNVEPDVVSGDRATGDVTAGNAAADSGDGER